MAAARSVPQSAVVPAEALEPAQAEKLALELAAESALES